MRAAEIYLLCGYIVTGSGETCSFYVGINLIEKPAMFNYLSKVYKPFNPQTYAHFGRGSRMAKQLTCADGMGEIREDPTTARHRRLPSMPAGPGVLPSWACAKADGCGRANSVL